MRHAGRVYIVFSRAHAARLLPGLPLDVLLMIEGMTADGGIAVVFGMAHGRFSLDVASNSAELREMIAELSNFTRHLSCDTPEPENTWIRTARRLLSSLI